MTPGTVAILLLARKSMTAIMMKMAQREFLSRKLLTSGFIETARKLASHEPARSKELKMNVKDYQVVMYNISALRDGSDGPPMVVEQFDTKKDAVNCAALKKDYREVVEVTRAGSTDVILRFENGTKSC